MGSINSRPKAPAVQPYTPIVTSSPIVETPSELIKSDAEIAAEGRRESLLRRNRGRFGTILTSFRGFLDQTSESGQSKKTLLGE